MHFTNQKKSATYAHPAEAKLLSSQADLCRNPMLRCFSPFSSLSSAETLPFRLARTERMRARSTSWNATRRTKLMSLM